MTDVEPFAAGHARAGRVCVVGSLNMDLIVRTERLPAPGETVLGRDFTTLPGGKGANQAVAAARAGAIVAMIGAVGRDAHGDALVQAVSAEGVDALHIARRDDAPTGTALITVAGTVEHGENTIVVAGGANQALGAADVELAEAAIADADALLMSLETPIAPLIAAVSLARRASRKPIVILNAAPARDVPAELLASIDCLVVNRLEAATIAQVSSSDSRAACAELVRHGPTCVVLTLGREGALAMVARAAHVATYGVPAFDVSTIDTVGAGDAFVGTLAASLARGSALDDALTLSAAAGALATTHRGAMPSLPTMSEVRELVASQPGVRVRRAT